MPLYVDRFTFAEFLIAKSLKLQYLYVYLFLKLFGGIAPEENFMKARPLIYTFWPLTYMLAYGLLRLLGLNVLSLRLKIIDIERQENIRQFNNPRFKIDYIIYNALVEGSNINL
jgi:hypothetical protein